MFHGDEVIVRYLNEFSHLIHSSIDEVREASKEGTLEEAFGTGTARIVVIQIVILIT